MHPPEIAVLVSSYQRPSHLRRSLRSLALQRGVAGCMEVVVTDDGSDEGNQEVVEAFAAEVDCPVRYTTHPHGGFWLARCRNEGVAVSAAPYLLFVDGDCILPPDHVRRHLEQRRLGRVVVGDCWRLDREGSERVTLESIACGEFLRRIPPRERRRLALKAIRAWCYYRMRCKMLPRMTGNNIGIWRADYERVNGFDENYVGWGYEDRDLQLRLSRLGLRFKSILGQTATCHLWHPTEPTYARNGVGTRNLAYYQRDAVPTRCTLGIAERIRDFDLDTRVYSWGCADDGPVAIPLPIRSPASPSRRAA